MEKQKQEIFEGHLTDLMEQEDAFIYKSNIELLKQFYNNIEDDELSKLYLNMFEYISDIISSKIESYFSDVILNNEYIFNGFDSYKNVPGVYFIYNEIDTIIYIGKTKDLSTRPLQSFVNKMPYGASYVKILTIGDIDFTEAVSIDYFLPIYNNKKEQFKTTYRTYSNQILMIKYFLSKSEIIKPYNENKKL